MSRCRPAVLGMQAALGELRRKGHMGDAISMVADFSERQRLVHKDDFDALERKYAAALTRAPNGAWDPA